jgi:hypothetical protein
MNPPLGGIAVNQVLSAIVRVTVDEGCPIRYDIDGSRQVDFLCGGDSADSFELTMHAEALREFLVIGAEALAKMDAIYAQEEPADDPRNR